MYYISRIGTNSVKFILLKSYKIVKNKHGEIMKNLLVYFFLLTLTLNISAQKKNDVIAEVSNDEVKIKLHQLIEAGQSDNGQRLLVAEITIENISGKDINMGAEYTMSIEIKDKKGNEYRSGLKGAGIVSSFLAKNTKYKQDQKAYNLSFGDKFPPKTKARSYLCGYEVPNDVQIVQFGVKKKNLWTVIK